MKVSRSGVPDAVDTFDNSTYTVVNKKFGVSLGTGLLVNSTGDNIVLTPTSGKSIRLKWFSMATSSANSAEVIVTVKLGANVLYMWPMGAPAAFAHGSVREGDVDEQLIVNLSTGQPVYVNHEYEEF